MSVFVWIKSMTSFMMRIMSSSLIVRREKRPKQRSFSQINNNIVLWSLLPFLSFWFNEWMTMNECASYYLFLRVNCNDFPSCSSNQQNSIQSFSQSFDKFHVMMLCVCRWMFRKTWKIQDNEFRGLRFVHNHLVQFDSCMHSTNIRLISESVFQDKQ